MTAETSDARGEVVAWFPTYEKGDIVRNYGDGSPVYASKTKEEAEQAKRCHLGATGPVIPLYAATPPAAARGDVRGLVGQLKHELAADKGWGYTEYEKGRIAEKERCIALLEALAAEGVQAGEVEPDGYTSYGEFRWACDCNERQRREWTPVYLAPPSAPVGVDGLVAKWDRKAAEHNRGMQSVDAALSVLADEVVADLRNLAQQPAAVDGARSGSSIMDGAVSFVEALATQHQEPTT